MKAGMNGKAVGIALAFIWALVFAPTVSATTLTTFADGSTTKTLTYATAGNQSVNITLPLGVSVSTATLDITGEFIVNWSSNFPEITELKVALMNLRKYVPTLADLDGDGDKDLLIGSWDGITYGFENNGTVTAPSWRYRSDWNVPSVGAYSSPELTDLDGDSDYDLLIGSNSGATYGFENDGTITNPSWSRKSEWDVPGMGDFATAPSLADLDGDGDKDLLIGTRYGKVYGFENDGTILAASWKRKSSWDIYGLDYYSSPELTDLDGDGDNDLLVGSRWGTSGFENNGSLTSASWKRRTDWDLPKDGSYAAPALIDLDGDGDLDLIMGEFYTIRYGYSVISGNPTNPSFTLGNTTLWSYSGSLTTTVTTPDFSFELNNYLGTCTTPQCIIPLNFYSALAGTLILSNLYIEYVSLDTSPPTYTNIGQTSTVAAQPTTFHALWQDNYGLSGYVFATNNSGTWVNDSWVALTGAQGWTNITRTLTSTAGVDVGWRIYANDSSNNWGDTGIVVLTTIPPADTTPPSITIASPGNATYATTSIALEVSADEPVHTWWYSLNGGADEMFTPPTTITAAEGAHHIIVYANDTTGNVGSSEVYFTVEIAAETPKDIKEEVIDDLEGLKSFTTNQNSIKEIDNAIEKIQKSLESVLWVGEDHLNAKLGHKVFDNERSAVELHLMKITLGKGANADPLIEGDVQLAIDALVNVDKILANISINDAKSTTVECEGLLAKAEEEMMKAQLAVDAGDYGKAIDHYKKAWKHAQHAMGVETAESELSQAICAYQSMEGILLQPGSEIGSGEYNDVIAQYLNPSLSRIVDQNYLDIKDGDKAFGEIKEGADKIDEFYGKKINGTLIADIPEVNNELVEIQGKLAEAARILADTLLTELGQVALTPKQQEEYDKGVQYYQAGQSETDISEKIKYYKKAWEHAQRAIKQGS